ncbi:MAG: hypothetical protein HUJ58_05115, partial [Erysipelotrichaceae bacterium]|nr:hypothetical protein [Erysipelotrichaceae bacterium]
DKVFLLSLAQVKKYFPTYNAKPTAYAIAKAGLKSSYDMCFWVTRSSQKAGATEFTGLAWVNGDGLTSFIPFGFTDDEVPKIVPNGIRPAMYIRF